MTTIAPAGSYLLTFEGSSGATFVEIGHNGQIATVKQYQSPDFDNVSEHVEMHEVRAILDAWREWSGDEVYEDMVWIEKFDA